MDRQQNRKSSMVDTSQNLGRTTLGDDFSRGPWKDDDRNNNDTKRDGNHSGSLVPSLTPAPTGSSTEQHSTGMRRVRIRGHYRHSSIPFPTRRVSTTPSALRDETEGQGKQPPVVSLRGNEDSIMSRIQSRRRLTDSEPCKPKLSRIPTLAVPSNGDEEGGKTSLPSSQMGALRFHGNMANKDDQETVPRQLDYERRRVERRPENRSSLPNPFIPISSHTRRASNDDSRASCFPKMPPFKHETLLPPLTQRRLASFPASEPASHSKGNGLGYKHLSLSPDTREKSSIRLLDNANSHVPHLQDQRNGNPIAPRPFPVDSKAPDPKKVQLKPLAIPGPKPLPTSRPQRLSIEDSPMFTVDHHTITRYPTLGSAKRTLRIRRETSSPNLSWKESPKMSQGRVVGDSKATNIEEQSHSVLLENPLRTPEKRAQTKSASPSSPVKTKGSPGKKHKDGTERMVSEKQPLQYWLGRLVTLSNAFHHEDSFDEPDPATGFGMKSVLARSRLFRQADLSGYRIKRAFMILERVCVTDEARRSYKEFRNEYVSQYGHQWMF